MLPMLRRFPRTVSVLYGELGKILWEAWPSSYNTNTVGRGLWACANLLV